MRVLVVTGIALATFCTVAHAQMYRWVDKDGGVHYTQTPPPADAKEKQKMSGSGAASASPATADLPYATQVAAKSNPVTLYTAPECGAPCDQARSHLVKRAVPFKETSVREQKDVEEVKNLSGSLQVPFLMVGAQKLSGYQDEAYDSLLTAAGYPAYGPRLPVETLRKMDAPSASTPTGAGSPPGTGAPTPGASGNSGEQMK